MKPVDKIDLKIMDILQSNGRITNQDLAEKIALSPSSCLQRVRRLESAGLIEGYRAKVNLQALCRHVTCLATVTMKNHTQEEFRDFAALVATIPEVVECLTVSGEFDFFLRITCADMSRYLAINDQLVSSVNYQVTINTHVVMREDKPLNKVDLATLATPQ
jgi:Lrp/AsnC family transcriptional regulator of ectoine degradation